MAVRVGRSSSLFLIYRAEDRGKSLARSGCFLHFIVKFGEDRQDADPVFTGFDDTLRPRAVSVKAEAVSVQPSEGFLGVLLLDLRHTAPDLHIVLEGGVGDFPIGVVPIPEVVEFGRTHPVSHILLVRHHSEVLLEPRFHGVVLVHIFLRRLQDLRGSIQSITPLDLVQISLEEDMEERTPPRIVAERLLFQTIIQRLVERVLGVGIFLEGEGEALDSQTALDTTIGFGEFRLHITLEEESELTLVGDCLLPVGRTSVDRVATGVGFDDGDLDTIGGIGFGRH